MSDHTFTRALSTLTRELDIFLTSADCSGIDSNCSIFQNMSLLDAVIDNDIIPIEAISYGVKELTRTLRTNHNSKGGLREAAVIRNKTEWMWKTLHTPIDDYIVGADPGTLFADIIFSPRHPLATTLVEAYAVYLVVHAFVRFVQQHSRGWRMHVLFLSNFERFVNSFQYASVIVDSRECITTVKTEWMSYNSRYPPAASLSLTILAEKGLSLQARCLWVAVNAPNMDSMLSMPK